MKKKNYNKPSTSTAEQRRNKIYAIILACAMIFWTIASLLGTFAFARTLVGSAETATVREVERTKAARVGERFQEVDLHLSGATWGVDYTHSTDPCFAFNNVSLRFYEEGGVEFVVGGVDYYQEYDGRPYELSTSLEYLHFDNISNNVEIGRDIEGVSILYSPSHFFEQPSLGAYTGSYVRRVNCSADVVAVDNSFTLTYVYEFMWYDIYGVYLGTDTLQLFAPFSVLGLYVDIIYPFTSTYTALITSTQTVDCGYWFTNYAEYFDNGYDLGSLVGFDSGYREGETIGYDKGVKDAGDYTFFTLISAVVDAPIQAFTGLFNFDLLGVNLADFFFGLLSVCTIIAIVRLFL